MVRPPLKRETVAAVYVTPRDALPPPDAKLDVILTYLLRVAFLDPRVSVVLVVARGTAVVEEERAAGGRGERLGRREGKGRGGLEEEENFDFGWLYR